MTESKKEDSTKDEKPKPNGKVKGDEKPKAEVHKFLQFEDVGKKLVFCWGHIFKPIKERKPEGDVKDIGVPARAAMVVLTTCLNDKCPAKKISPESATQGECHKCDYKILPILKKLGLKLKFEVDGL